MPEEKIKLPRSSYEELAKIVKSYGHFDSPVNLDEVSKLVGIGPTNVSANHAFLIEIEILEKGQKKVATTKGKMLAQALEHEMPHEIQNSWRRIVDENDFLTKLIASIRIRNGMDESSLESHIAYSAGEAKSGQVMTGARTVIDILRAAAVIEEDNGKLVAANGEPKASPPSDADTQKPATTTNQVADIPLSTSAVVQPGLQISIEVRVDCSFDQLDQLGAKLVKLKETLVESATASSDSESKNDN